MVVCPRRQVSLCLKRTVGRRPEVLVSSAILFGVKRRISLRGTKKRLDVLRLSLLMVTGSAFARRAKKMPKGVE